MIFWTEYLFVFGVVATAVAVCLHVVFAIAVYTDVQKLVHNDKQKTVLVPGFVWTIATLVGRVFVAIGYWVIHRSSIAKLERTPSEFDLNNYLD